MTLLLSLFACIFDEPLAGCTEIGCSDGAYIAILDDGGEPVEAFSGTATLPDSTVIAFECDAQGGGDATYQCVGSTLLLVTDAPSVELSVIDTATASEFIGTVPLDYAEVRPNGEDCPPVCEQAAAEVELTGCGDCG